MQNSSNIEMANTTPHQVDIVMFAALQENVDQFFLAIMGMCILFMQCGFAFLEAGAVRSKNTTNILIKNVMDVFIAGVCYWLFGYAFAFGKGNSFIGYNHFSSDGVSDTDFAFFFFQYTFAATAATIVSGAVAERCEFVAYFIYSIFITGFIYPIVTHWCWNEDGWLTTGNIYNFNGDNDTSNLIQVGYQDFAGSGVVHIVGGVAAFCGAFLLGPRIGRFHKESKSIGTIRGHSVPIAALGGFILFFGFLAFNGGSQGSISAEGDGAAVSISIVNTIISASCAAFTILFLNRIRLFGNSSWSLLLTINGALAGMVAICAGCDVYYPWSACCVGIIAAISYSFWAWLMKKLTIDDPLDAVAVHFGGGTWGVIAVAFFDKNDGILFKWNLQSAYSLAWQCCGIGAIAAWTGLLSFTMFFIMKLFHALRVSEEIEIKGLDIPKHNEPAYPVEAYGHGHIENILQILSQGPVEMKQGYANLVYESEIKDNGPYENPEVKAAGEQRNGSVINLVACGNNQGTEDKTNDDIRM